MDYVAYYVVGSGGSNDTYPGTDYSAHQVNDSGGGGNGTYVVQAGDTVSSMAAEMGTTVEYLAAANGIENPDSCMLARCFTTDTGERRAGCEA